MWTFYLESIAGRSVMPSGKRSVHPWTSDQQHRLSKSSQTTRALDQSLKLLRFPHKLPQLHLCSRAAPWFSQGQTQRGRPPISSCNLNPAASQEPSAVELRYLPRNCEESHRNWIAIALRDFASRRAVCNARSVLCPHRQGLGRSNLQDPASTEQQNTRNNKRGGIPVYNRRTFLGKSHWDRALLL